MTASTLAPAVYLDGEDVAGITLSGARIEYGRRNPTEPDRPATAFLTLVTADAVPQIADLFPAFGPGPFAARSGYTMTYEDEWQGVASRLTVGVPVHVAMESPSGYADEYGDEWEGAAIPRFTGRVTELVYEPGQVAVTAVDATERLGYVTDPNPYPEETDVSRARRLAALGGISLDIEGNASVLLAPDRESQQLGSEPVIHPAAGQEITTAARWARASFSSRPDGKVKYRTRDAKPNPYLWQRTTGKRYGAVVTRYNLVPNPGMYATADLWVPDPVERFGRQYQDFSPTGRPYAAGWYGPGNTATAYCNVTADVVPGVAYTFTVWVWTLSSYHETTTGIRWLDSDGNELDVMLSEPDKTPDLSWTLAPTVVSVAPPGAASADVIVSFTGQSLTAALFTAAMLEPTPFPFPYFDGSFPNAEWLGTPNASASEYESPPWPLPADRVLEPTLGFRLALGDVVNASDVDYVTFDAEGQETTGTVTAENPDSVQAYGRRVNRFSTRLVDAGQAQDLADAVVGSYSSPRWGAEQVTVLLQDADGREQVAAGTVTFGDEVQVGDLPHGAPEQELRAEVIGWTDELASSGVWDLTYYLAPYSSVTPGTRP